MGHLPSGRRNILNAVLFVSVHIASTCSVHGGEVSSGRVSNTPCSEVPRIIAPATRDDAVVRLDCSVALPADAVVTKRILIEGAEADGLELDCNGATLDGGVGSINHREGMIVIRSRGRDLEEMTRDRPQRVTIRNCIVNGHVRVQGPFDRAGSDLVRISSRRPQHTERMQGAAPSQIRFTGVRFVAQGRIPLYVAPGVTQVVVEHSAFAGRSNASAIYLDAESGWNSIIHSSFDTETTREQISVDGSAHNKIEGNTFGRSDKGGVFVYRNCGEDGQIRHQVPTDNTISGNSFHYVFGGRAPAIWLGSRSNRFVRPRSYCGADAGYPFGSSSDDDDHATGNTVSGNETIGMNGATMIRDTGRQNTVIDNTAR